MLHVGILLMSCLATNLSHALINKVKILSEVNQIIHVQIVKTVPRVIAFTHTKRETKTRAKS